MGGDPPEGDDHDDRPPRSEQVETITMAIDGLFGIFEPPEVFDRLTPRDAQRIKRIVDGFVDRGLHGSREPYCRYMRSELIRDVERTLAAYEKERQGAHDDHTGGAQPKTAADLERLVEQFRASRREEAKQYRARAAELRQEAQREWQLGLPSWGEARRLAERAAELEELARKLEQIAARLPTVARDSAAERVKKVVDELTEERLRQVVESIRRLMRAVQWLGRVRYPAEATFGLLWGVGSALIVFPNVALNVAAAVAGFATGEGMGRIILERLSRNLRPKLWTLSLQVAGREALSLRHEIEGRATAVA